MNEKEKQKLIEYLNLNFRAILSWGGKGVVPTGIFKVKDIVVGEIPEEYEDMDNIKKHVTQIILVQEDDEKKEIDIPFDIFLEKFVPAAEKNTESFAMGTDFHNNLEEFVKKASEDFAKTPYYELMPTGESISLDYEENGIQYYENGDTVNFLEPVSIFPVDLGKYREKEREITVLDFKEMQKKEEERLKVLYEKRWMKKNMEKERDTELNTKEIMKDDGDER